LAFDGFSSLALSLPEPAHEVISVIVHRLPNRVREQVSGAGITVEVGTPLEESTPAAFRMDSERDLEGAGAAGRGRGPAPMTRAASSESGRHRDQFTDTFTYNTNDTPIKVSVKVTEGTLIKDLIKQLAEIREVNVEQSFVKSELVLLVAYPDKSIRTILNPAEKLNSVQILQGVSIHAVEVVTRQGRSLLAGEIANATQGSLPRGTEVDNDLAVWREGWVNAD
jgi:hypothetical protein